MSPIVAPKDERPLRVAILGLGGYATRVAEAMKHCTRARLTGAIEKEGFDTRRKAINPFTN